MPKISVIVPVYKVEKYLNRCVDSILNQTFKDFEIILVDDGSPDNCPAICDEYAAKYDFVHVIHKENGGLSDARNYGIDWAFKNSDSEWITFIDSDDWVHKQYLEILYNACVENNVYISSCGYERVKDFSEQKKTDKINNALIIDEIEKLLCKNYNADCFNTTISVARLYNKELWIDVRFPAGKLFEDTYTTYIVLYKCKKIALLEAKLYYYFNNLDSIMHSPWSVERVNDKFNAIACSLDFYYKNNYQVSFYKQLELLLWSVTSNFSILKQKDKKALKHLIKRFRKIINKYRKKLPIIEYEDYYLYAYPLFRYRLIKLRYLIGKRINFFQKKK